MAKLEKREKIILAVMTVVVLCGIYTFFPGSSAKTTAVSSWKNLSELKQFATDVSVSAGKETLSAADAYAISRAESEWLRDPFYDRKPYKEWLKSKDQAKGGADASKKIVFNYSGYMEYGGKKIAIINGMEYGAGEPLEAEGYVLKVISPGTVIIENKAYDIKLEVPIQD